MHDLVDQAQPSADIGAALSFLPGRTLAVPVIAAVNGLCVGGGLCFVADADITIAAESAWFSATHVSMGQVGSVNLELASRASVAAVAQSALSGAASRIPASTALSRGLISEVLPAGQLPRRASQPAQMIAAQSPEAVRATLRVLRARATGPIERELDDAWNAVVALWSHPDATEGPRAHSEGRPPRLAGLRRGAAVRPTPRAGWLTAAALWRKRCAESAGSPFLWFEDQRWSYAEFDAWTNSLAQILSAHGIEPGNRVRLYCRTARRRSA